MLIACSRLQAVFPAEGVKMTGSAAAQSLWDEHGGTFVIRLEGLAAAESPASPGESILSWEMQLAPGTALTGQITEFAAQQNLPLAPAAGASLLLEPLLCACHLPDRSLFIFCEAPQLRVRPAGPQTVELAVTGTFTARRVPSRELDAVIHLRPAAMAQLLSFILAQAQAGL
jgi:hypothetical protein